MIESLIVPIPPVLQALCWNARSFIYAWPLEPLSPLLPHHLASGQLTCSCVIPMILLSRQKQNLRLLKTPQLKPWLEFGTTTIAFHVDFSSDISHLNVGKHLDLIHFVRSYT